MRYLMKVEMAGDAGDKAIRDPKFGEKMQALLKDMKAEAAYFTTVNGHRGGYIVVNMEDASQMIAMAEPLFLWLGAKVKYMPVMLPQDLVKGGPAMAAAIQKWG